MTLKGTNIYVNIDTCFTATVIHNFCTISFIVLFLLKPSILSFITYKISISFILNCTHDLVMVRRILHLYT
jgi:hypothetical protein